MTKGGGGGGGGVCTWNVRVWRGAVVTTHLVTIGSVLTNDCTTYIKTCIQATMMVQTWTHATLLTSNHTHVQVDYRKKFMKKYLVAAAALAAAAVTTRQWIIQRHCNKYQRYYL